MACHLPLSSYEHVESSHQLRYCHARRGRDGRLPQRLGRSARNKTNAVGGGRDPSLYGWSRGSARRSDSNRGGKGPRGASLAGVSVDFSARDGAVTSSSAMTDQSGTASPGQWVLSTRAVPNILSVRVGGVERVRFTAIAHPDRPASLSKLSSSDSEEVQAAGVSITNLGLLVEDRWGNPIPKIKVVFSLAGAGALTSPTVETAADGAARLAAWTLPSTPGVYSRCKGRGSRQRRIRRACSRSCESQLVPPRINCAWIDPLFT